MEESNYWKRLNRRRISRRALLGAGAATALGATAAALVGCGSGGDDEGTSGPATTGGSPVGAGTPRAGGNLTWGAGVAVTGLDPHIDIFGLGVAPLLYSYLYSWAPGREQVVTNNLAETFEQPDPEHLEFIFTLRRGVKAQPVGPAAGEEITSEDCEASFVRRGTALTAPDKRFPNRIDHYETPDPYTFKFVMKTPFVAAIREMANPTWAIVPKKVIEKYNSLSQVAFGSGPFILGDFNGAERIELLRHPDYFLKPRPWLDSLTYIVITDNSSLLAAFRSGQHDVNGAVLTKRDAEDLQKNDQLVVNKNPSLFYPVIHLKMKPPFDDIRVREALDLALDRDEIISVLQNGEGNYNGPIQWGQTKWALPQDELRSFFTYNPDKAKAILAEAGYPDGISAKMKLIKLTGPAIVSDTAVLIKDQLRRAGINIDLNEVEQGAFLADLFSGNFQMIFFPNLPYDEPDRPLSFYHSKGVSGSGNWNNYSNKEIDELINAQSQEFDEVKRMEIITTVQRKILAEHGPQISLTGGYGYSARWNYVHFGLDFSDPEATPTPDAGPFGADIWIDKG
ncbi:MAG: ABC transporter substrate-binding protein [Chloroflexi bacterium]|nr:ABC transporter substrate-binding protein [Chloroflexota bacterium]